jgi:hypothetical protein
MDLPVTSAFPGPTNGVAPSLKRSFLASSHFGGHDAEHPHNEYVENNANGCSTGVFIEALRIRFSGSKASQPATSERSAYTF